MSDFTIDEPGSRSRAAIPTEAVLTWKGGRVLPEVTLSFDGLNVPTPLFAELESIGWVLPPVPPRPSSAIEWTPDPVAGTDYTIHPWQVTDYRLGRGPWTPEDEEQVASHTNATLQRHAVVDAPDEVLEQLPTPDRQADTAPEVAPSAGAPQVILIDYQGAPHPKFRPTAASSGGRKRLAETWTETAETAATICATAEARVALAADSQHAWEVRYAAAPVAPTADQVAVCAAVPKTSPSDKKLAKLVAALGSGVQLAELVPLDPANGVEGALIRGVVPAQHAELVSSTLRLRLSNGIVRIDG